MNRNLVYQNVAKLIGFNRDRLGEIRLSDGKILLSHFVDIFTKVKIAVLRNKMNGQIADEFSSKSKHPWKFLNPKATVLSFCHLLARESNRGTAKIRAECMKPIVTKEMLTVFLAAQLEIDPTAVDLNQKVRSIKLPVSGYDKHSWVTFIIWADQKFGDETLQNNLDTVADITIEELFEHWMK